MELGGNKPWKDFFNAHNSNTLIGRDFDSCTISERYDSDAGEEWKERLTAKVEGTEYVPGSSKPAPRKQPVQSTSTPSGSGRNTPLSNVKSPPQRIASPSQKSRNEAYFARMGEDNASRPDDVPPSQGGKYAGFGSSPMPSSNSSNVPSTNDFQQDPIAALTKGFGWLSSTVSKQAANVNKAYIQPGMENIQKGDLAAQARAASMQFGTIAQQGVKGLNEQFNKFVDPEHQPGQAGGQRKAAPEKKDFWDAFGQDPAGPPQEKKDFWDDFAAAGTVAQQQKAKPTTLGTSAMKPSGGSGAAKKDDDTWGEW